LLPAREQTALSPGWHSVLACFGVAFPAMIFVMHWRGIRGDAVALELARRWSKASAVLFAIGAVSGTVLSFEILNVVNDRATVTEVITDARAAFSRHSCLLCGAAVSRRFSQSFGKHAASSMRS